MIERRKMMQDVIVSRYWLQGNGVAGTKKFALETMDARARGEGYWRTEDEVIAMEVPAHFLEESEREFLKETDSLKYRIVGTYAK